MSWKCIKCNNIVNHIDHECAQQEERCHVGIPSGTLIPENNCQYCLAFATCEIRPKGSLSNPGCPQYIALVENKKR